MKKSLGCLASVILSSIAGILVSLQLFNLWAGGAFVEWESTQFPTEVPPVQFLILEGPYVYLQTTDGDLFAQQLGTTSLPSWQVVDTFPLPTDPAIGTKCSETEIRKLGRWTRKPPGDVRQMIECYYYLNRTGITYRYALLENN